MANDKTIWVKKETFFPVVVRIQEAAPISPSTKGEDIKFDGRNARELGVEKRDPSKTSLLNAAGFFFADIHEVEIEQDDGTVETHTGTIRRNRSRVFWSPGAIIGTAPEFLRRYPNERKLIRTADRRRLEKKADRLVRLVRPDGENDGEDQVGTVVYLYGSSEDQVLAKDYLEGGEVTVETRVEVPHGLN